VIGNVRFKAFDLGGHETGGRTRAGAWRISLSE
jgi:nanoRNase/pAp phosphatase (c-di-AMP/oligoRNAs hydrolase)